MDASVTFGQSIKQIINSSKSYIGPPSSAAAQYSCPSDCYAFVYVTSWTVFTGTGPGTTTLNFANANRPQFQYTFSVTGTTTSVANTSMEHGTIFLGPGESLNTTFTPGNPADANGSVTYLVLEFNMNTRPI